MHALFNKVRKMRHYYTFWFLRMERVFVFDYKERGVWGMA